MCIPSVAKEEEREHAVGLVYISQQISKVERGKSWREDDNFIPDYYDEYNGGIHSLESFKKRKTKNV